MAILLLLLLLLGLAESRVRVNITENHGGLAFLKVEDFRLSQNSWLLSFHYDTAPHELVIDALTASVQNLSQQLEYLRPRTNGKHMLHINTHVKDYIQFELLSFQAHIHDLQSELDEITESLLPTVHSHRYPRNVIRDGFSNTLWWLFGTARDSDIEKLNERVNQQQEDLSTVSHLLDHQATFIP